MDLRDEDIEALGTQGFFIRTASLGEQQARAIHAEAQARAATGALRPAGIRRGADRAEDTAVRGDFIEWLSPSPGSALGRLWEAFAALGEALSAGAYLGLGRFDVQLAHYPGGGTRYVRHRDAFPGQSNRRLTAIYYANPDWRPAHGGQLRLYPGAGTLEVAPALDTLVVFLSERLEHEVLPTHAPRLALTAWYYGRDVA
ncbi:2OG-Fe(II) oxygenase [Stigmatella aurantiaca]|uniref:Egl nine-like protein n=1 Tax=Stigmatella aurantiaca (strain DW4/3-1) TaxID=378806 RepID=Q09EC1_STIAD|nr:2OG-Fe(II) oxygenase [Stigmatella aurantiaca]ADO74670.1 Egl nine-like protein [Stigmatella aurantiaca DW4/3-1]EAU70022.1 putative Egl nine homolog 2 [Stigmatella aurantiaca DW4/3-1]